MSLSLTHPATASTRRYAQIFNVGEWTAVWVLLTCYCAVLIYYSPLPFTDYPAHIARATAMQDLIYGHGSLFGQSFIFQPAPIPYVLGDLCLAALIHMAGPSIGSGIWAALVFLALPLALACYLKVNDIDVRRQQHTILLSTYLATDWFFSMGFLSFRLGVAITIMALAIITRLRIKWSWAIYVGYIVAVVIGYLTHLSVWLFVTLAASVTGLLRIT